MAGMLRQMPTLSLSSLDANTTTTAASKQLSSFHAVLCLLSLLYCFHVFWGAAEACYVIPCYEGPGLQAMWKVNKGVTFMGESSGVFAAAHAMLGCLLFRCYASQDIHTFLVGIFAGCTFCSALLSLNMVWVWGAEWNLLGDLSLLSPNNTIFEESGRHMTVNHPLVAVFKWLFYLSCAMCLLQSIILIQLLVQRGDWMRLLRVHADRISTAAAVEELAPLQSG